MAKVEIKITEKNGGQKFISAESIDIFSDTLNAGKVVIICDSAFHAGGVVAESYSRQSVLREEWRKFDRAIQCYCIDENNIITYDWFNGMGEVYPYSPTLELAEEIVQIREGKWLPKKGDYALGYNSKNGKTSCWHCADLEHDWTEEGREPYCHYFPSEKQRTAFIEKNKPKEETFIICDPSTISKEQQKFNDECEANRKREPITLVDEDGNLFFRNKKIYEENGFLKVR